MSHAVRMIAEAQARRAQALADDDAAEVRKCDAQIARWERVKRDVDQAPPLSAAQRDQLAVLLRSEPAPAAIPRQRPRAQPRSTRAA